VSVRDYGFLYGYGLFETLRAYHGQPFRLDEHLARLADGAAKLEISVDTVELQAAVAATIEANHLRDARVRITVSIGEGGPAADPTSCERPTVVVSAGKYDPQPEAVYERGFRAIVSRYRLYRKSPLAGLKSANYLINLLARREALAEGAEEAILLNDLDLITEGSTSNLFLVKDDRLITPGEASGCLPGITRRVILELADSLGINAVAGNVTLEELLLSDEAFLTNSLIEVMPLTLLDGQPVGTGRPGPVIRQLLNAYRRLVAAATPSE
jgi:aminodeoxychorismate lyase